MKKQILYTLITLISILKVNSQIEFKPGYFIKNNNEKIDCLIKDTDTEKNPKTLEYKLVNSDEIKNETVFGIKEFGILNTVKFIRYTGKMDNSDNTVENASHDKNPVLIEKTIFLKTLVEGTASLYYYKDDNGTKFFFKVNDSEISQLINLLYLPDSNSNTVFAYNELYKQKLLTSLSCESMGEKDIKNIEYKKKSLIAVFEKYNSCKNSISNNFEKKQNETRKKINLSLRLGVSNTSLTLSRLYFDQIKFDKKYSLYASIEFEAFFPIFNNKLSGLVEPNYWSYVTTQINKGTNYNVDAKYLNIPIGLRYYFFLNKESKIFVNALYGLNFGITSKIESFYGNLDGKANPNGNYVLGLGYNYNSRYSIETRLLTGGNMLRNYQTTSGDFSVLSLILGYKFL